MARRQARRSSGPGATAGFLAGLICGLGIATLAWIGGYLPRGDETPPGMPTGRDEPPIAEEQAPDRDRRYDFFTVLPEIEVVVPEREIEQRAREAPGEPPAEEGSRYIIQVGSFRSDTDADALKARVAMLGLVARVQTVTVDDVTWHRVRLGPFDTAGEADRARRQLQENGFEAMVLSGG